MEKITEERKGRQAGERKTWRERQEKGRHGKRDWRKERMESKAGDRKAW